MSTRTIVLASTSPYRAALLRRIGVAHVARAPVFDEIADAAQRPGDTALSFAEGKARSLRHDFPEALIIGADQTLDLDGALLRKPRDREATLAQLASLAGRAHSLCSAIAVLDARTGAIAVDLTTVRLSMRALPRDTLERYWSLDAPEGCVGGYTFERRGVCLFDRVEGGDDSAIVGLPLAGLTRCLAALGVEILDLCGDEDG